MGGLISIQPQSVEIGVIAPAIWICAGVIFTMFLLFFARGKAAVLLPVSTLVFIGGAFFSSAGLWNKGLSTFGGTFAADNAALFANFIFLVCSAATVIAITARYCPFSKSSPDGEGMADSPEVFPLLLTVTLGALIMAASRNLIVTFLGIETLSIPLYVLAGINLESERSKEASLKYFLTGAFASGFLAYGISLVYGAVGKLDYAGIKSASFVISSDFTMYAGIALIAVGFGFKVALVPFHAWAPDVYQGSPALITGFMASIVKAAGFFAVIRFFAEAVAPLYDIWWLAIAVLAVLTQTAGNILALHQTSLKRLLAYSSIAHAGYLALALLIAGGEWQRFSVKSQAIFTDSVQSSLFYLAGYAFGVIGIFTLIWWLSGRHRETALLSVEDVQGLGQRSPFQAAMMTVFLLSMAGFPLTAGFLGKFYLFTSALKQGFAILVVISLLNAVVSAYYYLKVIVAMYMRPAGEEQASQPAPAANAWIYAVVWTSAIATFWLGVIPGSLLSILARVTL